MKPILTIPFSLLTGSANGTKSVRARLFVFGFGFPYRGRKGLAAPILTILFSLLAGLAVMGQGYDAQWALGYEESVVDFRSTDTVKIDSLPTLIYFIITNAGICDEQGNLLYYTNGIRICTPSDTLSNGYGISPCLYSEEDSLEGLDIPEAVIFIPQPGNTRYYYLFHFSNDTLQDSRPGTLYFSLIDKDANSEKGAVVSKNNPILKDVILRGGGMTACKHANGRDYWLVMGASVDNMFYKFLITPDSILGPYTQNIGPEYPLPYDIAYSKFSQDGSMFVTGAGEGLVLVMNFDRCSGEFSNPVTIFNYAGTLSDTALSGSTSVEFSPNNRFVYVADNINLNQYDLSSTSFQNPTELFSEDSATFYGIDFLQIAPNGKMYGCTWNGGLKALHVINAPDEKGDTAGFVYGGQPTYTINSVNLPNLINYKLGPLAGSGCDTIPTGIVGPSSNSLLRILPNPADKYAYVEMGMQGNYEFDLLNAAGQIIDKKQTPQVDYFDTEQLSAGVYFIKVIDKTTGAEVTTKKLVVVH